MNDPVPDSNQEVVPIPKQSGPIRRLLLAALSAVVPGSGLQLSGKKRAAVAWFAGFVALVCGFWPLRLPRSAPGLVFLVLYSFVLCAGAAIHTARSSIEGIAKAPRWSLILLSVLAIGIASVHDNWMLRVAGFQVFDVPSTSMEPTITQGDRIIVDRWAYRNMRPQSGDIIIFRGDKTRLGSFAMKRLIATEGKTISGQNGTILLDDITLNETYAYHSGDPTAEMNRFGPVRVPAHKLFVMGDNRDVSYDSRQREMGPIDESQVIGRALYIVRSKNSERNGTKLR